MRFAKNVSTPRVGSEHGETFLLSMYSMLRDEPRSWYNCTDTTIPQLLPYTFTLQKLMCAHIATNGTSHVHDHA